ncbi:MAG: acyl carrier protein [Gammaproteobacteria bacterium]|nr:acyl carrier protein [Gammaproteobacteria bacterium]
MSTVEQKVRSFILENFMFSNDESALDSAESLLDKGVIDSTGVMELVAFLEDEYHFRINDEELVPENLDSVRNIVAFVDSKQAAA